MVMMVEAVIAVRRGRDGDLTRCNAIAVAQEEPQEKAQDSEPLDRILVEPPPEAQALPKVLNLLTNPCPNPFRQGSRRRRNVGVLTVVEHQWFQPFLNQNLSDPKTRSKRIVPGTVGARLTDSGLCGSLELLLCSDVIHEPNTEVDPTGDLPNIQSPFVMPELQGSVLDVGTDIEFSTALNPTVSPPFQYCTKLLL